MEKQKKERKKEQAKRNNVPTHYGPEGDSAPATSAVILDTEKYRPLLADQNLPDDQERDYIETVWAILLQCMMLGMRFEFDAESCGKQEGEPALATQGHEYLLNLKDQNLLDDFSGAADEDGTSDEKESAA